MIIDGIAAVAVFVVVAAVVLRSVAVGFLLALVVIGSASSAWNAADAHLLRIRWGALAALVVAGAALEARQPLRRDRGWLLLLLPLGIAFVSVGWSVYPKLTFERSVALAALFAAAVLLAPRLEPRLLASSAGVVAAGLAVLSFVLWAAVPDKALLANQLEGPLQNPNTLGLAMGLLVPLSLTAHTDVRVFARRGLLLLVPAAVCIAASGSRTGLLVTVVGLAVLALVAGPLRVPAAAGALLVIAATLVFSFTPLEPQGGGATGFLGVQNNPGLHRSRLTTVLGARNEAWSEAARIIKRRPVEGYGFGTGEDRLFDRFHAHFTWFEGGGPSDAYVQAVMDVGLVGVVILLVPLAAAAARALRRPPGPVWPSVMLAGTLVGAVFESIFASPGAPFSYFVWFSTAALLMRVMSHPSVPATT